MQKKIVSAIPITNNIFDNNNLNFIKNLNIKDLKAERLKRQSQNQDMMPQKKLVLIDKYCILHKTKF